MKRKIIKWGIIVSISGLLIGGGVFLYLMNMPHRNVQAASIDYSLDSKQIVKEYILDPVKANEKYLQEEGDSKIIAVTGMVASIDEDLNDQKVVLLSYQGADAGVSCTFIKEATANAENLKEGDIVTIKGVIRSGAGYDEDLELYEDVILEKCDILIL